MIKTAALLTLVIGLLLVGLMDHDGRIARGDLVARAFGYVVRFELKIERSAMPAAVEAWPALERCSVMGDSAARAVVWR
jgi:hypothetical protein